MRSLFWVALNIAGLAVLLFMYSNRSKRRDVEHEQDSMFRYLMLAAMVYVLADTGVYLADAAAFAGAHEILSVFTIIYYIVVPLPLIFFLLYCDGKIFKDSDKANKRTIYYLLPYLVYVAAVLSTPMTKLFFYINDSNIYVRGELFWVLLIIPVCYSIAIYPLLLIKCKAKDRQLPGRGVFHIYLFPLPVIIMTTVQLLNYDVLLLSTGFVFSSFIIFVHSTISGKDERSLATRNNYLNSILFIAITAVVMAGLFILIGNEAATVSHDYATYNSVGISDLLETYLNREIGVLASVSRSKTLHDWFLNEGDRDKKQAVFDELTSMLDIFYSDNIYLVVYDSGNEYTIDKSRTFDEFVPIAAISADNPQDSWVFELLDSRNDYNLNVGMDIQQERTRVWLNYKVIVNNDVIGILSTGMEISLLMEQILLVQQENMNTLAYVIDEHGYVIMNSAHIGTEEMFNFDESRTIGKEIANKELLEAIEEHLGGIRGYFGELERDVTIITLLSGNYRYAAIAPIGTTAWTLVILYDASSLFGTERLLPLFFIIAGLLVVFAYASNRIAVSLIFSPMSRLVDSLHEMRGDNQTRLYGSDRSDEIGLLSNAIMEFFVEGHHDALTGIYNRRYIEEEMGAIINTLQRSGGGLLSVLMIDIDYFKRYNDTYGHTEGDKCLIAVAKAISGAITRIGDFAARYGGEEFLIVLPNTDESGAALLAQRVMENIRMLAIPHKHNEAAPYVTLSIGGVTADTLKMRNFEDYIIRADEALYISKNSGRNRFTQHGNN